jgi:hypothetical protein
MVGNSVDVSWAIWAQTMLTSSLGLASDSWRADASSSFRTIVVALTGNILQVAATICSLRQNVV